MNLFRPGDSGRYCRWRPGFVMMRARPFRESPSMSTCQYPNLLKPFRLRHLTFRNRVMSTSHAPGYVEDRHPKLRYQLYHEEKAKGGLALTMFGGSSNIAPDSPSAFGQIYIGDDSIIPVLREFSERVHRHGCAIMCQITHMGHRTLWNVEDWLPPVAPSVVREPAHRSFPKEMDRHDIRRVVRAFGDAAWRCKEGGLDGTELLAQGHLIHQFWTPLVNRRTDEYGGSLANRARFGLEVLEEIRRRVGDDFLVGFRMMGDELKEGGLGQEDCLALAKIYADTGMCDFMNVIAGQVGDERGLSKAIPSMAGPRAPFVHIAAAMKRETGLAVFHATRITDLATAEHSVREGLVDMVAMTRAHMADTAHRRQDDARGGGPDSPLRRRGLLHRSHLHRRRCAVPAQSGDGPRADDAARRRARPRSSAQGRGGGRGAGRTGGGASLRVARARSRGLRGRGRDRAGRSRSRRGRRGERTCSASPSGWHRRWSASASRCTSIATRSRATCSTSGRTSWSSPPAGCRTSTGSMARTTW